MPFYPLTNQYLNAFSLSKNEFEKKTSANICLLVKYQCFICYIVSVEMHTTTARFTVRLQI